MFAIKCLWLVALLSAWVADAARTLKENGGFEHSMPFTHDVPRQEGKIDFDLLRKKHAESPTKLKADFPHAKELLASLRQNKKKFSVKESRRVQENIDELTTYEKIIGQESYDLKGQYTLFDEAHYFLLDDQQFLHAVRHIDARGLDYCGSGIDMKVGDFIVGGNQGALQTHRNAESWLPHAEFAEGDLMFSRRAVSVESVKLATSTETCFHVQTEMVLPQQLFSHFRLDSKSALPFAHHYRPSESSTTPVKKEGENVKVETFPGGQPDQPGYACSDTSIFAHDDYHYIHSTANDDFQLHTYGHMDYSTCVSITKNIGELIGANFNFNFCPDASGNPAACGSLDVVPGITCTNCYAYLGVYAYAVIEYWNANYLLFNMGNMAFEAKLYGSMGYNVDLSASNPSISSSTTISLVPAASSSSATTIPLGAGISLSTYFGGLNMVLSGSGSAQASASFGTGASATAYAGIAYQDISNTYGWTFPNDASFTAIPPSATGSLSSLTVNIDAQLVATQNFNIGYTYAFVEWVGAAFSITLTGEVDFAGTASFSATSDVSVDVSTMGTRRKLRGVKPHKNADPDMVENVVQELSAGTTLPNKRRLDASSSSAIQAHVGESLQFDITVRGFKPLEETVLFFALQPDATSNFHNEHGQKINTHIPLFTTKFLVPKSGAAVVTVTWNVPWDTRVANILSQDMNRTSHIVVRASNQMKKSYTSDVSLTLIADAQRDKILSSPVGMTMVPNLQSSGDMRFTWSADSLQFFQPRHGVSGLGTIITPQDVQLAVVIDTFSESTGEWMQRQVGNLYNKGNPQYRMRKYGAYQNTVGQVFENNGEALVSWPPAFLKTTFVNDNNVNNNNNEATVQVAHFVVQALKLKNVWGWSDRFPVNSTVGTASMPVNRHLTNAKKLAHKSVETKRHFESSTHARTDENMLITHTNAVVTDSQLQKEEERHQHQHQHRQLQATCDASCSSSLTYSISFSGAMTSVIVCDMPFSMTLSTGSIQLLAPTCSCLTSSSASVVMPASTSTQGTKTLAKTAVDNADTAASAQDDDDMSYYGQLVASGETFQANTVVSIEVNSGSDNSGDSFFSKASNVRLVVILVPLVLIAVFFSVGMYYYYMARLHNNTLDGEGITKGVEMGASPMHS